MTTNNELKPILKWAGGKRLLIPAITKKMPEKMDRYIEPFIGGGAVFWNLAPEKAIISDLNSQLIETYQTIRDNHDGLVKKLNLMESRLGEIKKEYLALGTRGLNSRIEKFPKNNERSRKRIEEIGSLEELEKKRVAAYLEAWNCEYEKIRNWDRNKESFENRSSVDRSARLIYLNHLAFNGLYRVNSNNEFNVPFGRYKSPKIFSAKLLENMSLYLNENNVKIINCSFEETISKAKHGDFIYADPPYAPLDGANSTFTTYSAEGFGIKQLEDLKASLDAASARGAKWLMSNVSSKLTRTLFPLDEYIRTRIQVGRSINCDGEKRGKVTELLISPKDF